VLSAGADAGALTSEGAALLDPTGKLHPGIPLCPPEGDAGTGMVATGAVAPRTGNVSAGTSIFAMVVLERPLAATHHELDLVTTPAGDPVAMVHCNNGASELAAWAGCSPGSRRHRARRSMTTPSSTCCSARRSRAMPTRVACSPTTTWRGADRRTHGGPPAVRAHAGESRSRTHARTALRGVRHPGARHAVLDREGVGLDRMYAHGGMFRTAGVAQRFLAGALDAPVAGATAGEGGAWGAAVLAAFRAAVAQAGPPPTSAAISPTSCSPTRRPRSPHPIRSMRPASPAIRSFEAAAVHDL
jgi:sugar (pentulose or hexulose) kinase